MSIQNEKSQNDGDFELRVIKKKVIIIGEGGVGKTTLVYRYINKIFVDSTKMTVGADFFTKNITIKDDGFENRLTILLWDFAGQERFRFVLKDYTRGAEAVILAFDLTRYKTLLSLVDWIDMLKERNLWGNPYIPIFLVGTKNDLVTSNEFSRVDQTSIDEFCDEHKIYNFYETSAKDGTGIRMLNLHLALKLIDVVNEKSKNH